MSIFKYKATNEDGRVVSGLVEAPSENIAIDILSDKQLDIVSLSEKASGNKNFNIVFGSVKPKDIVIFSRQFAVLIGASVALVQSLKLLADQIENEKLKIVVGEISEEIDGGARLSDSLAKRPKIFSDFYVNVIRSGESSGKLDEVLNYLADELEKDYDMTSKIKGAMIYPAFVFSGLVGVGALMMIVVVPKLTDILQETGTELPMATKILIWLSAVLTSWWWLLLIGMVTTAIGFKFAMNIPAFKSVVDLILLKTPIFGRLFQRIYLVRFTRSMQTLLVGGVNISKSLDIASDIITNSVYKNLIIATKKEVEDGNSIAHVFQESPYIPSMVSQMMSIGEKTGKLDEILGSISVFYTREIDNIVANLMTLMEPIIMVIMGVAVGFMVAAIIMPMYNMAA